MFKQGTLLQHSDSKRDLFTKVKSKYTLKICTKTKYHKQNSKGKHAQIYFIHRSKVQNCNLSWRPMLVKVDLLQPECLC